MMYQEPAQRYPIGRQTFSDLIEEGFLYVDKTDLVYRMTHSNSKYIFLSRPRRFGKSLLVSTLKSYFEGRKDLFRGLAMERLETEWTQYPVLHFSLTWSRHVDKETLLSNLNYMLSKYDSTYGIDERKALPHIHLAKLVRSAYEQTGKRVVVLIDWYDAPLIDVIHEKESFRVLNNAMDSFLTPLKNLEPYLRFVFITGITRFCTSHWFGGLNNVKNISIDENYATICGITEEELVTQLRPAVECLAKKLGISVDEAVEKLRQAYGGYHFDWPSPEVYSPMLLLNALPNSKIDSSDLVPEPPSYLRTMLRKVPVTLEELDVMEGQSLYFDAPMEMMCDAIPLLYQSGYISIKGTDDITKDYLLGIPNKETRVELTRFLSTCEASPR